MNWKDRIPGCFGDIDGQFAVHALDARRALELLVAAKDEGASGDEFFTAFRDYVEKLSSRVEHFDEQMDRIHAHYSAWF